MAESVIVWRPMPEGVIDLANERLARSVSVSPDAARRAGQKLNAWLSEAIRKAAEGR